MRRALRLLPAVAVLAAALTVTAAPAAGATSLPISDCTTTSGVILAVDFGHWGGPVLRACDTANGTTDTGYVLLNEGGWHTQGDQHDGPAFICRIGYSGYQGGTMYPTTAQDACVVTPPATAYWSYWHADPGQNSWSYSQLGAMSYKPKPGSVDAWVFGGTNIAGTTGGPTFSPDAVRAHNSAPPGGAPATNPAPGKTYSAGAPAPAPGGAAAQLDGTAAVPSTPASGTPSSGPTSSTTSSGLAPASSTSGTGQSAIVDAQPRPAASRSTGSVLPVVLGGALIVLLGAGAGVLIWRRRRAG